MDRSLPGGTRGILHPRTGMRRFRVERAASGADVDWAELAAELGYADQAHFTREFTAAVGTPPARYAREAGVERGPEPGTIDS